MRSCVVIACFALSVVAATPYTTEKALVRCPRVMCAMFCEAGFKTDSSGCPICDCLEDPCPMTDCVLNTKCRAEPCEDHPCTFLRPICEPFEGRPPCAQPMCANRCLNGYAKSPEGCDTCNCNPESCGERDCPEGTTCETRDNGDVFCKVRPLCHEAREMWKKMEDPDMAEMMKEMMGRRGHMMGHMMGNPFMGRGPNMQGMMMPGGGPMMMGPPMCDDTTGDFVPRQCHEESGHCFCVDDRGFEIDGTRTNDVDNLRCAHNRTSSLDMDMMVKHEMTDMQQHMDELKQAMEQGLGDLMQMDQRWINIVAITPDQNGIHVVSIHVVVSHDGQTDLPSAANFFQRQIHQGAAQIPFNDQILLPDPESIHIEHKFDVLPAELPEEHGFPEVDRPTPISCFDLRSYGGNHRMTVIMGAFGLIIIITATTGLALAAMRRRRMALLQYQHRRFENMDTLRKNIVASNELDLQSEEKKVVVLSDEAPPLEEKVSIA